MNKIIIFLIAILTAAVAVACKEDFKYPLGGGAPKLSIREVTTEAHFGDSLSFYVSVADDGTALSTLKVELYFSGDKVSETVIRTKNYGDYRGKLFVPFFKDIPDGTAQLRFVLQNVGMVEAIETKDLELTRPDFPYIDLVTENTTIRMERTGINQYAVTGELPQKVRAFIQAPAVGANGNNITFGWDNGKIVEGSTQQIPFSYLTPGVYTISFNTFTYEAAPFQSYEVNGVEMRMLDDTHYAADLTLTADQEIAFTNIPTLDEWWIDPDFIREDSGRLLFNALSGKYRITADFDKKYFIVEAMDGDETAKLGQDGSGAIWIIGEGIGKPSLGNEVGWVTEKALCLAPIGGKKYRVTVVAGQMIRADAINFKFFHQKGWGGEFTNERLSTSSDLIFIGDGKNGRDPGNLGVMPDKRLTAGATYMLTLDVSAGIDKAVLSIELK